jgi:hypothetical protein
MSAISKLLQSNEHIRSLERTGHREAYNDMYCKSRLDHRRQKRGDCFCGDSRDGFARILFIHQYILCEFSLRNGSERTLNVTPQSFNRLRDFMRGNSETIGLVPVLHKTKDVVVDVAMKLNIWSGVKKE